MGELLFLLLPIAAGYGWYMGRRSASNAERDNQQQLSEKYVAGLNYLLSDQEDKAVDLFVEMIRVDSDTIETHMALANLFRRKGEVNRALKLHQNLVNRPGLTEEQHCHALFELGLDYMAAGIYDRAESTFLELVSFRHYRVAACKQLLKIYQYLKDWDAAIEYASRLPERHDININIAQFYCEIAEEQVEHEQLRSALRSYKRAIKYDPGCVRAYISRGRLYIKQGKHSKALNDFRALIGIDIDWLSEVIVDLETIFADDDIRHFQAFLMDALDKGAGATATNKLAELLEAQGMMQDAEQIELSQLRRYPSLKGFYHYMYHHLRRVENDDAEQSLTLLQDLVHEQIKIKPKYCCKQCGFSGNKLYWQCPSCKSWGNIRPVRGLDGD